MTHGESRLPAAILAAALMLFAGCDLAPRTTRSEGDSFADVTGERTAEGVALRGDRDRASHSKGDLLVRFRGTVSSGSQAAVHRALGTRVLREFRSRPGLQHVALPPGMPAARGIQAFAARPEVEYAEPNYLISARAIPDDPRFPEQWALHNTGQNQWPGNDIRAPAAWNVTTG
ncbi:MAG TPA: hypothetical protein VLS93_01000, partial [Anaeromyxobacteraceae bacterium]|nr:hypothetical protein [Anaeromyxobacteraceae bacterium]